MRIYYFDINSLVRKTISILLVMLGLLLAFKLIQDNLFKPAVSNFEPIYQGSAAQKKIALACNVDWGEEYLPQMLEILKKNKVNTTFFMSGKWVARFPALTREIAGNHELGNHGYSHPHPTFISKRENQEEIKKTEQVILKATAKTTRLYAPPYGEFNKTVLAAAGELGYQTILWSIDTRDWQRPSPDEIVRRVCDKAHNGAIVLMHPTEPAVRALPALISELQKRGYRLTTVSEVIGIR